MVATHNAGPNIVVGYYPGSGGSNPEAGPSATYMADSILDPRWPPNPGATGPGHVKGFLNHPYPTLIDAVPATAAAAQVCPALAASTAIAVAAQTFPMQTTNSGLARAVNMPVPTFGKQVTAANNTPCMVLDPGHTIGTTSVGSKSVTAVGDTRLLVPGQWIAIPGALTATTPLIARVLARTATTLTLDTAAGAVVTGGPVMVLDPTGIGLWPGINCGAVQIFDPYSSLARAVSVVTTASNAADAGYVVTVSGFDVFLNPMTEVITSINGATAQLSTASGKKAFKYISGVTIARGTGGATVTGSISVGTTDIFGFNLRVEKYEYTTIFWNGGTITSNTGLVTGLALGTASTSATADVRGTYAVQSASNGSARLAVMMSVPLQQLVGSTYADYTSLLGQAQA